MRRVSVLKPSLKAFAHQSAFSKRFISAFNRCNQKEANDVFGIEDVTKEDITGVRVDTVKCDSHVEDTNLANAFKEKEFVTAYGTIRFDSHNKVKAHGQFDEDFDVDKFLEQSATNELNFIDKQYFDGIQGNAQHETDSVTNDSEITGDSVNEDTVICSDGHDYKLPEVLKDANFIDKQYFLGDATAEKDGIKNEVAISKKECPEISEKHFKTYTSKSKISKRYEVAKYTFDVTNEWKDIVAKDLKSIDYKQRESDSSVYSGIQFAKSSPLKDISEIESELRSVIDNNVENEFEAESDEEEVGANSESNEVVEKTSDEQIAKPKTAFEYYQQLKRGVIEPETEQLKKEFEKFKVIGENMEYNKENPTGISLDSQGFRTFKEQRIDYSKFRNEEIVWNLKRNILFDDCDVLAINKPYGITCHGYKGTAYSPLLHELLPQLAPLVNVKELFPVHRLDKDATGVLLLAKTKEMASLLLSMFKDRQIKKYYTAITRGVPTDMEGIIDIPMERSIRGNKERMVLRPDVEREFQKVVKPSSSAKRAVTHYRVKKSSGNASLLEIFTETGVKHQIRCHLGFGLRTPILGDHKYSHLDRLAPQKLPTDMLLKLNVRQSKVRNIPLHLHCRLIVIPEIGRNGSTVSIMAHLPFNFKKNANSLGLK